MESRSLISGYIMGSHTPAVPAGAVKLSDFPGHDLAWECGLLLPQLRFLFPLSPRSGAGFQYAPRKETVSVSTPSQNI